MLRVSRFRPPTHPLPSGWDLRWSRCRWFEGTTDPLSRNLEPPTRPVSPYPSVDLQGKSKSYETGLRSTTPVTILNRDYKSTVEVIFTFPFSCSKPQVTRSTHLKPFPELEGLRVKRIDFYPYCGLQLKYPNLTPNVFFYITNHGPCIVTTISRTRTS